MDFNQKYYTVLAMRQFGGNFIRKLADALEIADVGNTYWIEAHLLDKYPEYMPGGKFYKAVEAINDTAS